MTRWTLLAALAARIITAAPLAAQNTVALVSCTFDTVAFRDTSAVTLAVRVMRGNDTIADPLLTQTIGAWLRQYVHLSASVGALLYPYTTMNERSPGWTAAKSRMHDRPSDGELSVQVAHDGTIKRIRWFVPTFDSTSNAAIVAAFRLAEAQGRFGELQTGKRPVSGLEIQFVTDPHADGEPIARLHANRILISSQARVVSGKAPTYPPEEHGDGRVKLSFVVDEQGSVVPTSIRVLAATSEPFMTSAVAAARQVVYAPAMAGSCPVKERITTTLTFRLVP